MPRFTRIDGGRAVPVLVLDLAVPRGWLERPGFEREHEALNSTEMKRQEAGEGRAVVRKLAFSALRFDGGARWDP
jgi:hypothetical protein